MSVSVEETSAPRNNVNNGNNGNARSGTPEQPAPARGLNSINSMLNRPFGRNPSGELLMAYAKGFRDILESHNLTNEYELITLDAQQTKTAMSALVLVGRHRTVGSKVCVAAHTLLLEGTGSVLPPRNVQVGNQRLEVMSTAGDVFNVTLKGVVRDIVVGQNANGSYVDAGCSVIPKELAATDLVRLQGILSNAINAVICMMNIRTNGAVEEFYSLSRINKQIDQIRARIDYAPTPEQTLAGLPVRNDIQIQLYCQEVGTDAQNQNFYNPTTALSVVSGYVDLVYQQPAATQQGFGQVATSTVTYRPRFVMTASRCETNATTLELQLLALISATMVSRNTAWAGVFEPRHIDGPDLRDIGAVGYEVALAKDANGTPLLVKIDTKASTFDESQRRTLLGATMYPDPIYAMHVEEAGDLSWIQNIFTAVAANDPHATKALIAAADNLTANNFSKMWKGGPIIRDTNNRIHLGYYVNEAGTKSDIRDIDYLAMLNLLGAQGLEPIVEWSNTFERADLAPEQRTCQRLEILKRVFQNNLVIKGYARLYDYQPGFVECLAAAAAAAGLVIAPENLQYFGPQAARGSFDYSQMAYGGQGSVFQTVNTTGAGYNPLNTGFNTWG